MDWWTLVFAAVAAGASALAVAWGWSDRPQYGWHIRREETATVTPHRRQKLTFVVRAVGTAVVHNAEVRVAGAVHAESQTNVFRGQMSVGSEPIVVDIWPARKPGSQTYVEIIWTRLRPYREYGLRVNAQSMKWEKWQWYWHTIRLARRPGGGWWTTRPARLDGDWVPDLLKPRAEIPLTDATRETSPAGDGGRGDEIPPA
jgi:hypothetical protein